MGIRKDSGPDESLAIRHNCSLRYLFHFYKKGSLRFRSGSSIEVDIYFLSRMKPV